MTVPDVGTPDVGTPDVGTPGVGVVADVAAAALPVVVGALSAAVAERGVAGLVLAGGGTPLALYRLLAEAEGIDWAAIHVFWGDERLVPPDDPGSNYHAAHEALLSRVPIPEANVHRVRTELPAASAVADYAEQLRAFAQQHDPGCPSPWPRFDVVLLGLGEDGHTASLFPGSPAESDVPVLAVTADYQGRPAGRVTLTPAVFNAARRVIFLVSGAAKAEAVAGTLGPDDDPVRYPARRIQLDEGKIVWFVDQEAAKLL